MLKIKILNLLSCILNAQFQFKIKIFHESYCY